jgi:hypothetical protein
VALKCSKPRRTRSTFSCDIARAVSRREGDGGNAEVAIRRTAE